MTANMQAAIARGVALLRQPENADLRALVMDAEGDATQVFYDLVSGGGLSARYMMVLDEAQRVAGWQFSARDMEVWTRRVYQGLLAEDNYK